MPLSEHEQRQLEQIEQALYREDPKFGRLVRSSDPRVHYKRKLVQASVGVLAGAGAIAAGVVTHRWYLYASRRRGCGAVAGVGDRQLAAARGPGTARADQGQPAPGGRYRPVPAGLASPADGTHGRAVAPSSGGRPPDVAPAEPATPNADTKGFAAPPGC